MVFRFMLTVLPIMLIALGTDSANGGQFNLLLSIGDVAPQWKELEGVDGKKHSYGDVATSKFVVVAFTCNSCPYAVDAEDRLIALSKKTKELGGTLVAININTIEEDALPAMKEKAASKKFDFPYLFDPTQEIAKAFGAKTTPEFYVLDAERKIVYMGSLDDSPDGKAVTKRYVETAIGDLLDDNAPTVAETVPIGCRIRFARTQRKRTSN
jgi:peroxiredoxin